MDLLDIHTVDLIDGRRVSVLELGAAAGWPVLAVHGASGTAASFRPMAVAAAAGVRLLAPDRPGCGDSSPAPHQPVMDWPFDVEQVVDRLGIDRFAVFAAGDAVPVAAATAYVLPHRVAAVALFRPPESPTGLGFELSALTVPTVIWREPDRVTVDSFAGLLADLLHVAGRGLRRN